MRDQNTDAACRVLRYQESKRDVKLSFPKTHITHYHAANRS